MELITRRNALLKMNPLKEYTITGNPAVFNTNVAKALTQFLVPFAPVQSGSGDPSPSNVRAITGWTGVKAYRTGKNLFDEELELGAYNTTTGAKSSSTSQMRTKNLIPVHPSTEYRLYIDSASASTAWTFFCKKDGTSLITDFTTPYNRVGNAFGMSSGDYRSFTTPSDCYYIKFYLTAGYGTTYNNNIWIVLPDETGYSPYSGNSYSVAFPALGKNLFNKNAVQNNKVWWKGNLSSVSDYSASEKIPVIPGEKYTLIRATGNQNAVCLFDCDGNYIEQDISSTYVGYTIPNGVYYVAFSVITTGLDTCQFEKSSSATSYEPYTNTVYGGTLDLATGVLTAETGMTVFDGSSDETWTMHSITEGTLFRTQEPKRVDENIYNNRTKYYCNSYSPSYGRNEYGISGAASGRNVDFVNNNFSTLDAWRENLAENPIQFAYPLSTPASIQLDPVTIESLIGDNTIWSDTNGTNTIKYLKKG